MSSVTEPVSRTRTEPVDHISRSVKDVCCVELTRPILAQAMGNNQTGKPTSNDHIIVGLFPSWGRCDKLQGRQQSRETH